jgi:NADPH-dependent 2,4-dienoyl-CoA reductase/sulfur reductase-like enzyme
VREPVVVVGGGPAGLACAIELRRRGIPDVVVLDREQRAGGVPRHCAHQGFGLRDLRRFLTGPRYARRYAELARASGARVLTQTMVTGWAGDELEVTSPTGRDRLRPGAIVLVTGCRERPRPARLVPGSRPEGVMTTGLLQQLVERGSPRIGTRALIVGAEHVSYSALLTLVHARVTAVGIVTELPRHQTLAVVRAGAAVRYGTPLWTNTAVAEIRGMPRVEEVELLELVSGRKRTVACDTIVFTGDWIPDHELAVAAGLELDPGTRGPRVDPSLRTTRPGVFAAGNLLQGAEPADIAALSGRHAAASVRAWLTRAEEWPARLVPIGCTPPLAWISPNGISPTNVAPWGFALRATAFLRRPQVRIFQDGRLLWSGRVPRLGPGRSTSLPSSWITHVDPDGAEITVAADTPY